MNSRKGQRSPGAPPPSSGDERLGIVSAGLAGRLSAALPGRVSRLENSGWVTPLCAGGSPLLPVGDTHTGAADRPCPAPCLGGSVNPTPQKRPNLVSGRPACGRPLRLRGLCRTSPHARLPRTPSAPRRADTAPWGFCSSSPRTRLPALRLRRGLCRGSRHTVQGESLPLVPSPPTWAYSPRSWGKPTGKHCWEGAPLCGRVSVTAALLFRSVRLVSAPGKDPSPVLGVGVEASACDPQRRAAYVQPKGSFSASRARWGSCRQLTRRRDSSSQF